VADGTWRGTASGGGIRRATVGVGVTSGGRVLTSFGAQLLCTNGQSQGFSTTASDECISVGGAFTSPTTGPTLNGGRVLWSGTFDGHGHLNGLLQLTSPCTGHSGRISFRATHGR
jgi:hypothetical protein